MEKNTKPNYRIYSNRSHTPNSSRPWIVAERMCELDQVGVVIIASGTRSLVRGKIMAQDNLSLAAQRLGQKACCSFSGWIYGVEGPNC